MNQFFRSLLLSSLVGLAQPLTAHATANDSSVNESNTLYFITVEHGYKNDPKETLHISANYMQSLIWQCVEAIVKNSGKNSKYEQYSVKITYYCVNITPTSTIETSPKVIHVLINLCDFLAVQYFTDGIAKTLCKDFNFNIEEAQAISREAFAYYQNKQQSAD